MKPYVSYKPSGVPWLDDVPEHWEVKKIKFLAQLVGGKTAVVEAGVRYVGLEHIEAGTGKFVAETEGMQTEAESTVNVFESGCVLFGKLRPYLAKAVVADTSGVCSSEFLVLRPTSMNAEYLKRCLLLDSVIKTIDASTFGSKMPRADWAFISQLGLPQPPLAEQQAIADYLDTETARIDDLMSEKESLIGLLREYRQSVIAETVLKGLNPDVPLKHSGVPWLGDVPAHWKVEKLKFFVRFAGGGTPSKDNDEYWCGDIPWVSPKDMKRARIGDTEDKITEAALKDSACSMIPAGAVLIVVRSGILQHSIPIAINDVPVALNQDMRALLPEPRVENRFLVYQIQGCHKELREEWVKQGATVESVEHQRMADSRFALPSHSEQQAIADYLDIEIARIDDLVTHTQEEINLLKELRAATIADAVTGKIQVS
jgi:type I restriction enzyme S subunit